MADVSLQELLKRYRDSARSERDKGSYFERFATAFLKHDPLQVEQYEDVESFAKWAAKHGWDARDTGIDLVAKLRDEDGYAAIQCKFYNPAHRIRKEDIDSFISASGKKPFKRRVVIDTTLKPWSENAETMIQGQAIPVFRIGLTDLEESPIRWETFFARDEIVLADRIVHAKQPLVVHPRPKKHLDPAPDGLKTAPHHAAGEISGLSPICAALRSIALIGLRLVLGLRRSFSRALRICASWARLKG
jgi:predicted helicase